MYCRHCGSEIVDRAEFLVAFSCQRRGFCPSCAAKRGAMFGALLADEVLEEVGHCLWTFTIPKMLRPFLLHHRELLGRLCQAG
ncbi:MAG TPA: transposase zinc-binding domain-containing protein [Thermoanaerobaculia bacterium]|nr:transposase zinc-binding domain-containing protein [Thermoanaerobaculia bacterium]